MFKILFVKLFITDKTQNTAQYRTTITNYNQKNMSFWQSLLELVLPIFYASLPMYQSVCIFTYKFIGLIIFYYYLFIDQWFIQICVFHLHRASETLVLQKFGVNFHYKSLNVYNN